MADTPDDVLELVAVMRSWEADPNGYKIKLGEIDHHVRRASDMLARYAETIGSDRNTAAPLDLAKTLRGRCGICDHRWIIAHLPLDASKVGRFAKVACPACGERNAFMDTSATIPTILQPYLGQEAQ
jgi:hypothetical protein